MTLEELSEASGVSGRAISDMERGHSRAPQARTLAALADALGLAGPDRAGLLELARSGRAVSTAEQPRLCELPRGVTDFVGRDPEMELLRYHGEGRSVDDPTPVALVHGQPGLGKTALVVRVADELRDRFPDGRFYVDLRGTDPAPVPVGEALVRILRALGFNPRRIAADDEERASQLRASLRQRRCLLVLDNAANEAQVRPLLPGPGPGMVLVTSRRTLGGLEGVLRVRLAPLSPVESAGLLQGIVGDASAGAAEEVGEVARLCGNLPLALRIAGTRLASRPGWTMAHLAVRLSDADRRLSNLTAGDLGVEAAFALSYAQLSDPAKMMFRRLAHTPGVDFAAPLAAVLTQTGVFAAEDQLDELVDLGLLQPEGVDRYRFHDLIRLFAAERLRAEEPADVRTATEERMVDWLLDTAIVAGRWFEPAFGAPPADRRGLVPLASADEAQVWLQVEGVNWLAALRLTATAGRHQRVVDVAEAMHWYSDRTISWGHWPEVYSLSRTAAARLPDRRQEITHITYLAWATAACEHRYEQGATEAMEAYRLAEELGDAKEQARALSYAASAWRRAGNMEQALRASRRSQELADAAGDHDQYVQIVIGVGLALSELGRFDEALPAFRAALREVDERPVADAPAQVARVTARVCVTNLLIDAERWAEALDEAALALPLATAFGEVRLIGYVYLALGRAHAALGATDDARSELTRALGLLRDGTASAKWIDIAKAELVALDS